MAISKSKSLTSRCTGAINGFHTDLRELSTPHGAIPASLLKGFENMDICLHLGAHRTGSTSFQVFMNTNRKAFLKDRTTFWGPGRTRSGLFAGLVRDTRRLTPGDRELGQRSLGRIKMEMSRAALNGNDRLVISEENTMGTLAQNFAQCQLYPQAADRLARFAPALGGQGLRIGLAIRSYDSYWASALAFGARAGRPLPTSQMLDRLTTQPRRWRHIIADIAHVFPEAEIAVWSFEAWASQQPQQVCALTNRLLPRAITGPVEVNNASPDTADIAAIARERGDTALADRLAATIGRYQPFDAAQAHKLRQDYATDIDWLKEGSAGLATYYDPTGDTSGASFHPRGRHNDQETRRETSLGRPRHERVARPLAG